jgi:hypothetical protein
MTAKAFSITDAIFTRTVKAGYAKSADEYSYGSAYFRKKKAAAKAGI